MNPVDKNLEDAVIREMNRFRGKVLGAIEAFGLPERQEAGIKTVVKNFSYEAEKEIKSAIKQ